MMIQLTEAEYQELMRVKRQHQFITESLYARIEELREKSDKLNKISFKTGDGDQVQNIEWVTLRYEISFLLDFVPDEMIKELYK